LQASTVRLLHLHGDTLNVSEWLTTIDGAMKPYERLACIRTLGVSGSSAEVSLKRALSNPDILQANAYTEAFIESHSQANFPTSINYSKALIQLLERSDIGITALCAAALREVDTTQFDVKDLNQTMLHALGNLQLPKEIETANEIIKTLNIWAISPRQEIKAEYNNPIDWNLVKSIPRRQRAKIHTSKGVIEIELHIEDAPGSVASFVKLCREGFYNGKSFHRVVPNFVIQGGCPRGDGMGGTDYTLRSEFRLHDYRSGSVGLASSGPDTESCQWFITHIPTPHLEGRYTIFAHVTKGLDIVDQIVIGDSIEKIELLED
jgi:cyclophilin family peptidyl-prolyl cis-trans isomerase